MLKWQKINSFENDGNCKMIIIEIKSLQYLYSENENSARPIIIIKKIKQNSRFIKRGFKLLRI